MNWFAYKAINQQLLVIINPILDVTMFQQTV